MNVLVFDIETVPDVVGGRRLLGLGPSLSDQEVAEAMMALRRQSAGTDFQCLHLHRIVAISIAADLDRHGFRVWSLGDPEDDEAELIRRFFDGVERYSPRLVSWNGGGFDLPVLHYRALLHGITARRYWDSGQEDRDLRFNNYLNRFHDRHTDLMDVLAGYQARANAPLDEIASLLGYPGKMGMSGGKVWEAVQAGELGAVRDYCETDVLNTYLIWLRYQLMRGRLTPDGLQAEEGRVKEALRGDGRPHLQAFLAAWEGGDHGA
ncbi:3'-5' exonuclease [Alkalilimnicola ehrlichii]|uniref:3'-5' exonuclease n=1 Tax=Alkalilimnicola ehrlichii TaxID=351052 RepID=UPI003BA34251